VPASQAIDGAPWTGSFFQNHGQFQFESVKRYPVCRDEVSRVSHHIADRHGTEGELLHEARRPGAVGLSLAVVPGYKLRLKSADLAGADAVLLESSSLLV
jgi:hypothetical protein